MAKRIISSFLAFLLLLTAVVILGVALSNVLEFIVESIACLVEINNRSNNYNDYYYYYRYYSYGDYLLGRLRMWFVYGGSSCGIAMKIITSVTLACLAIFIISYKKTKSWGIIRKIFGVFTSLSLVSFIITYLSVLLVRGLFLLWRTTIAILSIFSEGYWWYDFEIRLIWKLGFQNALMFAAVIIAIALIAYILYLSFKKNMTKEEKLKRDLKLAKERKEKLENKINKMNEKYVTLKSENSNDK